MTRKASRAPAEQPPHTLLAGKLTQLGTTVVLNHEARGAAVLVWVLRRRGALTLPRVALSAVASVVVLVVAGVASYPVWRLALLIDPAQASVVFGEPYRPLLCRLAMLVAGLAAVLSPFALLRRRLGAVDLAVGMLVVPTVSLPGRRLDS